MHRACAKEAVSLAVLDLYATGADGFRDLRKLRRQHPSVTLVLYVAAPPTNHQTIFELGRFGVDGLAVLDQDDGPSALRTVVEQAEARSVTAAVRSALGHVRPTARDAALIAVTRAHQRLTPQQLASILGIRRRALAATLEAAGLPAPAAAHHVGTADRRRAAARGSGAKRRFGGYRARLPIRQRLPEHLPTLRPPHAAGDPA